MDVSNIYPIIATWIADWPEQNNITCTTQGGCPKCMQQYKGRGQGGKIAQLCEQDAMLEAIQTYQRTKQPGVLKPLLLQPVTPFWADIPHVDIGGCMAPDLLHQLYKGVFEHAQDWVKDLLGTKEFNQRFKSMPQAQGLQHFKNGITTVKVWAGRESREMMQQLLPVVIDAQVPPDFIQMVCALLDFCYLAHSAQLTDDALTELDNVLAVFHQAKYTLVDKVMVMGKRSFDHIPKIHMLGQYMNDIHELGTPDGYSTETPEHLHIIYVKMPWWMSNCRNPIPQIVQFVGRIEAIEIQRTLVDKFYGKGPGVDVEETDDMYSDEREEPEGEGEGEDSEDGDSGHEDNKDESEDSEDGDGGHEDNKNEDEMVKAEPGAPETSGIHYPRPVRSIAKQLTEPKVPRHVLMASYHVADLIQALQRFLLPMAQCRGEDLIVLPSDRFHVWHKVTLNRLLLPFAPDEPCQRDMVRAHPALRDGARRVKTPGVFDTVLFRVEHNAFGLNRYRAGRLRAIFSLPPHP